ncbi:aldose 1-epimerase family protein [Brytella acorum]|uniref:Aldose 1-epimerase family protein n=1 Tax=Brytella acorum TaxID=2959299 RepID=A0AA35UMV3_9PROT|nr:aldose 1-epimerase family protein [Brytella acorum]MDF3625476.1 aldose 1-epimerase family protein [Brytella acorum]CAI9120328.1 aldose 1-epimerase family protein [Brytella acorum]
MTIHIPLDRKAFGSTAQILVKSEAFTVTGWTYPSGVMAVAIENTRGRLVVLPFMGQMIWSAVFDGCNLRMTSIYDEPLPSVDILGTYGCFMFHAGLLRNGCPGPDDTHPLHGEMPCAPMNEAWIDINADGKALTLGGVYRHVEGFGSRYDAYPSVTLRDGQAMFDVSVEVVNRGGKTMDLMYMAHTNYAYVPDAVFVEPFGIGRVDVRTSVPAHVHPTEQWQNYIKALKHKPGGLQKLDAPEMYEPEIVSFLRDVGVDSDGQAHFFLRHPEGAAFYTRYAPIQFTEATRWVLHDPDYHVAGFVLPATCDPEGYQAEKRKGKVRQLKPGERAEFGIHTGFLNAEEYRDELKTLNRNQ